MSNKEYIQIQNINKIFGPNPESVLDLVADGIGKSELQSKHNHVLALQDINGSVWLRKINSNKTSKSINPPNFRKCYN
jgi:ABC-type proline/glycine betaine transport system ATPase subunit